MARRVLAVMAILAVGCADDGSEGSTGDGSASQGTTTVDSTTASDSGGSTSAETTDVSSEATTDESTTSDGSGDATSTDGSTGTTGSGASTFIAVTFNTGGHADGEQDVADDWYGNGLSWIPAVEQTQAYLAALQPDIIAFQEIFHSPDCAEIPAEFQAGYVCEAWTTGDPTVSQVILGAGYQVACNLEKTDKCLAVKTSFGTLAGCDADLCLDGLDGAEIDGCGNGSRVGRGLIELSDGGTLTVVNFHGTSGISLDDQGCRVAQLDHVFQDMDGEPAANGDRNLILGDFNTDPARATVLDFSAQRLNDYVGGSEPFQFLTEVGTDVQPTYAGAFNIDHVISDTFEGQCWHPGITEGYPAVVDFDYYDHVPAVCEIQWPQ